MIRPDGNTARRLKKLRYRFSRPSTARYGDIILPLDFDEISEEMRKTIYFGRYEVDEAKMIEKKLSADDIVLEIGAGIGYLSALCAKRIGSDRVFAFEANALLERVIRRTYALNEVQPELTIAALGAQPGTMSFFLERNFWSSSLIRRSPGARSIDVEVRDAGAELSRIRPTFVLCDIEGGEAQLIPALDFAGVRKLSVEFHPHVVGSAALNPVLRAILDAGFSCDFQLSRDNRFFFEREEGRDAGA